MYRAVKRQLFGPCSFTGVLAVVLRCILVLEESQYIFFKNNIVILFSSLEDGKGKEKKVC